VLGIAPGCPSRAGPRARSATPPTGWSTRSAWSRNAALRRRDLGRRADLGPSGIGHQRREPVQRRRLRALHVTQLGKWDGCATKNYVGIALAFTPTWFQSFPGVDLSLPVSYSRGLSGNSPLVFGGNQGLGNYSIGLGATCSRSTAST
jgi:hypothetical protein